MFSDVNGLLRMSENVVRYGLLKMSENVVRCKWFVKDVGECCKV